MFEKKRVWYIECRTGCSCCAYDNFDYGFYDNPETPQALIDKWLVGVGNPLGSQYARYGIYKLHEVEAEILPDGRWIIEDTVFNTNEIKFPEVIDW
jgi:hypothetical protein